MKPSLLSAALFSLSVLPLFTSAQPKPGDSPADHLPSYITQVTDFGERPDWSADGKRLLFLSKTFGDAMEVDLATHRMRNLTAFYPHYGYTRALYLSNGDILLAGPQVFDPKNPGRARWDGYLYVLDRSGQKPAVALGSRINEGPAVSRRRLHLAWAEWSDPTPTSAGNAGSKIFEADIVYVQGSPHLENRRLILDAADLPFQCTVEPQNFRPPGEKELTFSIYSEAGKKSDVGGIDLQTKKVTNYTHSPDTYDEPEGIFPDGSATLVECDQQNHRGTAAVDLWKLALDGSGRYIRLSHFSDYPTYKASNPVVSDDGRFMAFQMGRSGDATGVGHGIFVYDFTQAPADAR